MIVRWFKGFVIAVGSSIVLYLIEGSLWWILVVLIVAGVLMGIGAGLMRLKEDE